MDSNATTFTPTIHFYITPGADMGISSLIAAYTSDSAPREERIRRLAREKQLRKWITCVVRRAWFKDFNMSCEQVAREIIEGRVRQDRNGTRFIEYKY